MSRLHSHIGTFRQLEILLALYDEGSVNQAAEKLHLTQPTVSMQLKKLSEAIGLPLYQNVGRQLLFTDAGKATVKTAREILDSCNHLDMQLSALKGLKSGTLRLAVVTTAKYAIPHLLGPFCQRLPGVDVKFTVGNREQIINRMSTGLDDFYVFSHVPDETEINTTEFLPNPLVAVCDMNHPLADKDHISLMELKDYPFLRREEGSGTRHAIETFLQEQNIRLNVKMTVESNEAIKHCVLAGLGYSILSAHPLAFGENQGLKILPVAELPINSTWFFVWRKNKALSPIAQSFLDYVLTEGQQDLMQTMHLDQFAIHNNNSGE